jgi:hypothetical protein
MLMPFRAIKDGMLPLPEAGRPTDVWSFVQLNVVPLTLPEKVTGVVPALLHTA